jgi:hypothetical protein
MTICFIDFGYFAVYSLNFRLGIRALRHHKKAQKLEQEEEGGEIKVIGYIKS